MFVLGSMPLAARQQAGADRISVPLSDPSRPGVIDISLVQGSITVRGTNRKDVAVVARPETDRPSRRYDPDAGGLRRLPQSAGFKITEEGNRVKMSSDSPNRAIAFEIEAPARTNLKLSTVNGGEILVENIEGDLEVSNVNGSVTLNGVAGSVMAGTTNGSVRIDFPVTVQGTIGKSFSTDLGSGGATLRVRTSNGGVRVTKK